MYWYIHCVSISRSIYLPIIYLPTYHLMYLSLYLSTYLSTYLYVCPSFRCSIYLSVPLSFIYLCVYVCECVCVRECVHVDTKHEFSGATLPGFCRGGLRVCVVMCMRGKKNKTCCILRHAASALSLGVQSTRLLVNHQLPMQPYVHIHMQTDSQIHARSNTPLRRNDQHHPPVTCIHVFVLSRETERVRACFL
jgi:hypothetical protein